ncbi:MAG: hypothetical protein HYX68_03895 [Planctomycetes bacterium]|nr:hypothetical protein [Planctomycetota bacterium]
MYRFVLVSFFLAGAFPTSMPAQDLKKEGPKEGGLPAAKQTPGVGKAGKPSVRPNVPGEVEVIFRNGSKIRLIIKSEKLEIASIYGKLSVPIEDVKAIEFGLRFPEGAAARIDAAVKNLGHGDYRERQKAVRTLIILGPYSYSAVVRASQLKDRDVASRTKEILDTLRAKHAKKDLQTNVDDRVITPTQTLVGRILTRSVKTQAEYFGEMEHQLANMRTLRAVSGPGLDLEVKVDAGKYAIQNQWMETTYEVDGQTEIIITAKGFVDTWPQGPGQYMTGPSGNAAGRFAGGPGAFPGGRIIINGQSNGGMRFGKIGENGDPFIIGDRYVGKPEAEGKLYLHIGPIPWNCPSAGAYDVKITRKSE